MRKFATSILLFATCCGLAQSSAVAQSPAPPPEVWIQTSCGGKTIHDGDILHAPTNIFMFFGITSAVTGHPGDFITIDLMADTNKLCSKKCPWHKAVAPDPHARTFQPMIMRLAGFDSADFDWTNAPVGSHVLTAHAFGLHGLSVASAPLHITIVSSASPPTGGGS